jgi:uncharacterized membrane protein YciS (DUF1049 family)
MPLISTTTLLIALGIGALVGVAAVVFWNYIVAVFQNTIRPLLASTLGDGVANSVCGLVEWLDNRMTMARTTVRGVWREFKARVLGVTAVYKKKSATTATVQSEAELSVGPGKKGWRKVKAEEKEISLKDLPPEVRAELERDPAAAVVVDVTAQIDQRVPVRAAQDNIPPAELDLTV